MAQRRHLATLVLTLLALLLLAYVLVVDQRATDEEGGRKSNLLPVFHRDEIESIEIRRGGSGFRLVRRRGDAGAPAFDLEQEGAPSEPADMTAVGRLIGDLELAVRHRKVDADVRELGLEAPRAELVITMGRLVYRLAIGKPAPAPRGAAYARLEGQGPCVVSGDLLSALGRAVESYRTKVLVPYPVSACERIDVSGGGPPRRLRRAANGELRIETERGLLRVDRAAAERLLGSLSALSAESFLSAGQPALAGEALVLVLTPRDREQPSTRIEIGGPCPSATEGRIAVRYAPLPRIDACVAAHVTTALAASATSMVDLHLFSLRADETEEILLERGSERFELARSGTSWHMRFPRDVAVEAGLGDTLAHDLSELSAEAVIAEDPAFVPRSRATVLLYGRGGDRAAEQTVELGETRPDGSTVGRRSADGAWLRLGMEAVRTLAPATN